MWISSDWSGSSWATGGACFDREPGLEHDDDHAVGPVVGEMLRVELRETFSMMESKPQAYGTVKVKFDADGRQVPGAFPR